MSLTRVASGLAWTAGAAALAVVVAAAVVGADADSQPWKLVLLPAVWTIPGAVIAAGRPGSPLGWLMIAVAGLFAASAFATQWVESGHAAGAAWAIWTADRGTAILVPCTLAVLLLLPDGRLPSPRWRPVAIAAIGAPVALVVAWSLVSGPAPNPDSSWPVDPANPVGVLPSEWSSTLAGLDTWVLQAPLLLGLCAVVARLRRADDDRRRLVGVLAAAAVFAILVVVGRALWPAAADVLDVVGSALLATTLTSAALRRRLRGVELVVHHAFVYAVLTAAIALGYVGVVAAAARLGHDLPAYGVGLLTAAIALCLVPLRGFLQRQLARAMYGDARDPGAAVRRLTESVGDATSPEHVASGLARATAASLRARFVEVDLDGSASTHGSPGPGETVQMPLWSGDAALGTIAVTLARGRQFRQDDLDLLAELADHGSRAVHAAQLADALRANRQLLVTAREEERSRLRRDLHDELGPTLAGLTMQLGGLQEVVRSDPDTAADRLRRLESASRQALEDVRRLSRELRPPSLDEVGLVAAIVRVGEESGLTVDDSAGVLPSLPAAVEVAAYRIGVEAILNVARHAQVPRAELDVSIEDRSLVVRVRDHGEGLGHAPAGVGILAMRERAEELGGMVNLTTDRGTMVEARLPLPGHLAPVRDATARADR